MRVGTNPNRHVLAQGYKPYVASAVVHLPNFEGYHEHRFEVVKTSLTAMRENAGLDCDILIWDNGSCQEFRDWLLDEYKPTGVVLSPNVGLTSGRAGLLRIVPPSTIIGLADDDMYYYPNWFKASVELMRQFPNVGQVSGWPVRTQMRWGNKTTLDWARRYAVLEEGKFIPEQWDRDFCTSIGREWDFHVHYTKNDLDKRITYQGHQAYAVAHHCQFVCKAENIVDILRQNKEAMSDDKVLDNAVDVAGYLRLTTIDRYVRHIGNVLDEELKPKRKRHA
jgi:hypothetical protein